MTGLIEMLNRAIDLYERNVVVQEKRLDHSLKMLAECSKEPIAPCECGNEPKPALPLSNEEYRTSLEKTRKECDDLGIPWTTRTSQKVLKTRIAEKRAKLYSGIEETEPDTTEEIAQPNATEEPTTIDECREAIMRYHSPPKRDGQKLIKDITGKDSLGEIKDPAVFGKLIIEVSKLMGDL